MIQGFYDGMKLLMTFNNLATPHKGVVHNEETDKCFYRRDTGGE